LRLLGILSLLLISVSHAFGGALPAEPAESRPVSEGGAARTRPPRDKWLRVGMIWGATALDLASTRYALSSNPATRESNPLLGTNAGGLRTGVYLGISLPLDALASYANLKYPHSRSIRVLTYVTTLGKIGIGVQNFKQAK